MQIKKRNDSIVDFDMERIINAIEKAMSETHEGIDRKLAKRIADNIKKELDSNTAISSVEEIQDLVEKKLMDSNRKDVAKKYILYRELRSQNRTKRQTYTLLDDDFITNYKHAQSPMQPLGEFVFYRTYSRYLPEEKRREYWWETCRRAVEYNCSLVPNASKEEAQALYDNMFNLRQFLSGRTLWSGNTQTALTNPASQFNCSGMVINDFHCFKEICYLLMLGVGVGINIEQKYISELPKVRNNVQLVHKVYKPTAQHARKEITEYNADDNFMEIIVGDSKSGWSMAIDLFLQVFYNHDFKNIEMLLINYDNVRPYGEKLKTFGGKASGHEALIKIFDKLVKVLLKNNNGYKKLKPIDALDIATIIAEGIVVGGVRRSALLTLFDADDEDVMNAKKNLYMLDDKGVWVANQDIIHRMMSNNSVAYYSKPSLEELKQRFETIKVSAEGNFFNMQSALKRNPNAKVTNPCGKRLCLM